MLRKLFWQFKSFRRVFCAMLLASLSSSGMQHQDKLGQALPPPTKLVVNGVELHYIERGHGEPVVFVHGALDDYRAWAAQIDPFAKHFRVIAYSRRYNFPNKNGGNPIDHSAIVEAEDLEALLRELRIDKAHLIGSSYGAYTVLILAIKHPKLVRSLTLAEPPVHRWVADLPEGRAVFEQFMDFWNTVGDAFREGDSKTALRLTASFFTEGKATYETLPAELSNVMQENIAEWKALTTSRDAFPFVDRRQVQQLRIPTLLLCGEKTLRIHKLVNDQLDQLLKTNKRAKRVTISRATHEMWSEQPEACRQAVFDFLKVR